MYKKIALLLLVLLPFLFIIIGYPIKGNSDKNKLYNSQRCFVVGNMKDYFTCSNKKIAGFALIYKVVSEANSVQYGFGYVLVIAVVGQLMLLIFFVMKKIFTNYKHALLFFSLLLFLVLASFWRVLTFGPWVDDAHLLWASLYSISYSQWYYNHPGLPLEFLLLSHIFGTNYVLWQWTNIFIKVSVSFLVGQFIFKLTNKKKIAILAAIFFAVSYVGLEVVDSPIMNIAGIVAIPILLSLYYTISLFREGTNIKRSVGYFLLAFLLDPGRVFSVVLILPLLYMLVTKKRNKIQLSLSRTVFLFVVCIVLASIFIVWFIHFEPNAQITQGIVGLFTHTNIYITKLNRIGNMFAAIGNLFVGFFYTMKQDYQDTGYYDRLFGVTGFILFFVGLGCYVFFLKKQGKKTLGIIGFLILWMFIFYLPNWFSEPRAPMAGGHRYLFLSSIGFVGLIAYIISLFKKKWIIVILSIVFILLNIWRANQILFWQNSYRSQMVLDRLWSVVLETVPKSEKNDIFIFTGEQPWLSQSIQLFGADRFLLLRRYSDRRLAPVFLNDSSKIFLYLCRKNDPIPLSHIYSWEVKSPGVLINKTQNIRTVLQSACP
ncbi:MAG TPA: hypothetical protein VLB73_02020 [Patescibacteria group bacterium]|nr:hypothetical protein [Patescibacteria group bacterium]